jgi:hypothetical protein
MLPKKKDTTQISMFFGLEDTLNQKHTMYILAKKNNVNINEINLRSNLEGEQP